MTDQPLKIVLSGEWLYDGATPMTVHVVQMGYDYWYELAKADDQLEPDEKPDLNPDGVRFDLLFRTLPKSPRHPDRAGGLSVDEAKRRAEQLLPTPIQWR
ncbi:hypothetical protein [Alienimonas sp. DA493]|uniref:hypothetical protein n=1 Tax=Alienimonas sp. DA493 TaxID=3373605 RepID=UPI003754D2DD